jgi:hypothetical protein
MLNPVKDVVETGVAAMTSKHVSFDDVRYLASDYHRGFMGAFKGTTTLLKEAWKLKKEKNMSIEDALEHLFIDSYNRLDNYHGRAISSALFKETSVGKVINHIPLVNYVVNKSIDAYGITARTVGYHGMSIFDDVIKHASFDTHIATRSREAGLSQGFKGKKLEDFVESKVVQYKSFFKQSRRGVHPTKEQVTQMLEDKKLFKTDIVSEAVEHMREMTFTTDLHDGSGLNKLLHNIQKHRAENPSVALSLIPFYKTPINILKEAGRHTPGLHKLSTKMKSDLEGLTPELKEKFEAGKLTEADLKYIHLRKAKAHAKLTIGTAVYMGAAGLFLAGRVTGAMPERERQTWKEAGIQDYSILINGKWVSYRRLPEPLPTILGLTADVMGYAQRAFDGDEDKQVGLMAALIAVMANTVLSKASLQGVQDALMILESPEQFAGYKGQSFINSMMPLSSGVKQHQEFWHTDHTKEAREFHEHITKIYSPWLNRDALDSYGKVIENKEYYSPLFKATPMDLSSPIRKKALELGIKIGKPRDIMSQSGVRVKLKPEHQWEYLKLMENLKLEERLNQLVSQKDFNRLSKDYQKELIRKEIRGVRRIARGIMLPKALADKETHKKYIEALQSKIAIKPDRNAQQELYELLHIRRRD